MLKATSRPLTLACLAVLVGCTAQPGQPGPMGPMGAAGPQPAAVRMPGVGALPAPVADGLAAGASLSQSLTIDVDPIHGAAFERPADAGTRSLQAITVEKTLRLLVDFPQVQHDLSTGRTTVTMQLTNAGDSLNFLACKVGSDKKVVSPAWQWNTTVSKSGQTQTQALVFDNPGGGGFSIELTFTGIMAGTAPLSTATATTGPSTAPSTAPTATPTPVPTAAPTATPVPTAAPTTAPTTGPTPAGPTPPATAGWVATASSTYGNTPPARVLDGDLATQWANDGYRAPSAWLAIDTGAVRPMGKVSVKMVPQNGGGSYRIETSNDGAAWTPVTGPLRNTSYNMEDKPLPAGTSARHLRLSFTNDAAAPETRFSVYELKIDGAGSPVTAPEATPTPAPTSPPAAGTLVRNFDTDPLDSDPADFIDPRNEGWSASWLPQVQWKVTERDGSRQYMHNGLSNTANLSFRRYRGTALGTTDGLLPARYFAEVEVTPIQSYTYAPTGDQGTQFYYVDPKNYLELLIKPNYFEVWSAINAEPFGNSGWTRLFYQNVNTAAGQKRKLGAAIDTATREVKIYLDGAQVGTVSSSMVYNRSHWFSLRGTGNIVTHDNIRIEPR